MTRGIAATRPVCARLKLGLVAVGVLALAGCARGSVQDMLGMGKRAPDEFAVVARAPLIIPPDFDLRPPRPGEGRPAAGTTSDQARATLLGQSATAGLEQPDGGELGLPATTGLGQAASGGLAQAAPTAPARAAAPGAAIRPATAAPSAGQQALLAAVGGGATDPDIRQRIAEENQSLVQVEQALFTRVMKWREPSTLAATVDAPAEAERLRVNKAKGAPPTAGDTPTVVERRQSPLGALVDRVF